MYCVRDTRTPQGGFEKREKLGEAVEEAGVCLCLCVPNSWVIDLQCGCLCICPKHTLLIVFIECGV